jgi:hypothetical protein
MRRSRGLPDAVGMKSSMFEGTKLAKRGHRGAAAAVAIGCTVLGSARDALAHGEEAAGGSAPQAGTTTSEALNPWDGSRLIFDQSMTTQTASVGPTPQSYVPLYELWFSLRPLYWFDRHWSLRGRLDLTKELTNNQATTYYQEDVLGDIWTDIVYSTDADALWRGTHVSGGLRALWPTSKISEAEGTYVTLGARAGAVHDFILRGQDAPWLGAFHVALKGLYLHPFTSATTSTSYGNFSYVRQNVDGFSFVSDQIQGETVPDHIVWWQVAGALDITPKLSFSTYLIALNEWHYASTAAMVQTATGTVAVPGGTGSQFTQQTWFLANLDYSLLPELSLSIGYYNLANAVAPDGQVRSVFGSDNIWWSPDARFFADLTANLDAVVDDALHHKYSSKGWSPSSGL